MWKFTNSFMGNGHDQHTSPNTQDVPTQSWYPSSAVGSSPTSSHLSTQGNMQHRDRIQSPAEAARIIACLKDKSVDELRKLLNDPDAYEIFFQSLEQVKSQNHLAAIMGERGVKLFGKLESPFVLRVELALKLKGVQYEYVYGPLPEVVARELKNNIVNEKDPVLIHNGKPIAESLVIIEYIDEIWKGTGLSILPADPYERAVARFLAKYADDKLMADIIRSENDKLRAENMRYKDALSNSSCPNCGGPAALGEMSFDEQHLRIENARLREEIERISGMSAKFVGKTMQSYPFMSQQLPSRTSIDVGVSGMIGELFGGGGVHVQNHEVVDKPVVIELAVAAMEELVRMAQIGEPLWVQSGTDNSTEILNEEEYFRTFPRGIGPRPYGLKSEASRQTSVVIMNHNNLVEILMDVNQWSTVFCSIVSKAMTIEVLSTGIAGNYNGALQVMSSEVQVPSPLVPTRDSYFVRYCKQHGQGTWAVVDVSLESLQPNPVLRNRKRPSGCLIQEMPNGYSKVTWVEHVEVDDRSVNEIYKPLVNSGLAFGAKRWLATLDRQCERLASVMATNIPAGDIGVITSQEGRKSMLKLAERMVMSFCNGVSESTTHQWTTLSGSGAEDVRVMTRKSIDDPGRPPGIVLSAATSFWLPIPPARVFDFLRDENSRNEWDILSNGGVVQEMAHIANGREQGNSVSLLRVNSASSSQSNMLILQESCTDPTGSFVIYAPVDIVAMNVVLNGGDPDYVALLPSGFAVLPDGPLQNGGGAVNNGDVGGNVGSSNGGSLLTVAFQILVDSAPTAKLSLGSVATVNSLISCTVERIKGALSGGDTSR